MNDNADDTHDPKDASPAEAPSSPLAEEKAKAAAAVTESEKQFFEVFYSHANALKDQAFLSGWEKGFSSGWTAATQHFQEEAQKAREAAMAARPPQPPQPPQGGTSYRLIHQLLRSPTDGASATAHSAISVVRRFIKRNQGLRGVEIAKALSDSLPERTVRTALHRLKVSGRIKNVNGGWWYVNHAMPNSQPQTEEDDDAAPSYRCQHAREKPTWRVGCLRVGPDGREVRTLAPSGEPKPKTPCNGPVAKLVDAAALGAASCWECRFNSDRGHHLC